MMGNYFGGGYGYMGGFGFLLMFVFWGLVIWAIIAFVQSVSNNKGQDSGSSKNEDSAMKTLRERYAKGEVTQEQFEQMKKTLGN